MKRILYLSVFSIIIFSCSSSKKFNFGQAYKFSKYSHAKQQPSVEDSSLLLVSRESSIRYIPTIPDRLPMTNARPTKQLTKRERKNLFKEIKEISKELKQLRKENPGLADTKAQQATKALTGKVYIGSIIGIAGLILLILNIAAPLGVLAFVVGLGIIVWGLIERGSI